MSDFCWQYSWQCSKQPIANKTLFSCVIWCIEYYTCFRLWYVCTVINNNTTIPIIHIYFGLMLMFQDWMWFISNHECPNKRMNAAGYQLAETVGILLQNHPQWPDVKIQITEIATDLLKLVRKTWLWSNLGTTNLIKMPGSFSYCCRSGDNATTLRANFLFE